MGSCTVSNSHLVYSEQVLQHGYIHVCVLDSQGVSSHSYNISKQDAKANFSILIRKTTQMMCMFVHKAMKEDKKNKYILKKG